MKSTLKDEAGKNLLVESTIFTGSGQTGVWKATIYVSFLPRKSFQNWKKSYRCIVPESPESVPGCVVISVVPNQGSSAELVDSLRHGADNGGGLRADFHTIHVFKPWNPLIAQAFPVL